jgi:hypothetical protein
MPRLFAPLGCALVSLPFWCGLLASPAVHAETEAIRIEYRAIAGCPSAEEFRAKVFERAKSARLASDADAARTFVVAIERRQDSVSGSLVVREPSGETVAREVRALMRGALSMFDRLLLVLDTARLALAGVPGQA